MKMIGNQGPGKTPRIGLLINAAKPIQEIIPVRFIPKDPTTFNPSGNNVMQSTRCLPAIVRLRATQARRAGIYPRLARQAHSTKIIIAKLEN
jgi:hypothetical protein